MRWISPNLRLQCAHRRNAPSIKPTAGVHELDTMCDSQAVRIAKGKGKASLLSCGAGLEEKARISGFTIKSAKFWTWPMRASHDSALLISKGLHRSVDLSSCTDV